MRTLRNLIIWIGGLAVLIYAASWCGGAFRQAWNDEWEASRAEREKNAEDIRQGFENIGEGLFGPGRLARDREIDRIVSDFEREQARINAEYERAIRNTEPSTVISTTSTMAPLPPLETGPGIVDSFYLRLSDIQVSGGDVRETRVPGLLPDDARQPDGQRPIKSQVVGTPPADASHLTVIYKTMTDRLVYELRPSEYRGEPGFVDSVYLITVYAAPVRCAGEVDYETAPRDTIRSAQSQIGVSADGIWGPQSRAALERYCNGAGP